MGNAGFLPTHETKAAEHLRAIVRWINACIVVGTILAAGLGAMALAGGTPVTSGPAASGEPTEYTAADTRPERSGSLNAYKIVY
jgi:hypothetical protein